MTSLIDAVRSFAEPILDPILGRRRTPVQLRHRATGALFGHAEGAVSFDDEDDAWRFVRSYACEPGAWEIAS